METIVLSEMIASYGALGAIAVYLAIRDYKFSKSMSENLKEITVAVNTIAAYTIAKE